MFPFIPGRYDSFAHLARLMSKMMRSNKQCPDTTNSSMQAQPPKNDTENDSFTLFANLPKELRLQIWKNVTQKPQTIMIRLDSTYGYDANGNFGIQGTGKCQARPTGPVPALLHTNSESRQVALKTFRPIYGSLPQNPPCYFDCNVDIMYFRHDSQIVNMFLELEELGDEGIKMSWDLKENVRHIMLSYLPSCVYSTLDSTFFMLETLTTMSEPEGSVEVDRGEAEWIREEWRHCVGSWGREPPEILFVREIDMPMGGC